MSLETLFEIDINTLSSNLKGSTHSIATLPRAKSSTTLVPSSSNNSSSGFYSASNGSTENHSSSSITSLLAAMFPDLSRDELPGYRPSTNGSIKCVDLAQLADCFALDSKGT